MHNDAEHDLLKTAAEWAEAMVSNDAARIGSFMADEWVIVSERDVSDRRHFLSMVESGDLTHSAFDIVEGTSRVRVYGDTAVLTARVTNTAHYRGHEFLADEWTTDVFVRRGGKWKCVLSHITPAKPGEPEGVA